MADIKPSGRIEGGGWVHVSGTSGSDNVILGGVHEAATGSWMVTYIPGSPTPSTFYPATRPLGSGLAISSADTPAFTDTEGTTYTAGVATSASKTFRVPAGGQDVILVVTNGADGGTFYCKPVVGE